MTEEKNKEQGVDFSRYMGKPKSEQEETILKNPIQEFEPGKNPKALSHTRKVAYSIVLIILILIFAIVFINRPDNGSIVAPEGYQINSNGVPPKLEKAN